MGTYCYYAVLSDVCDIYIYKYAGAVVKRFFQIEFVAR